MIVTSAHDDFNFQHLYSKLQLQLSGIVRCNWAKRPQHMLFVDDLDDCIVHINMWRRARVLTRSLSLSEVQTLTWRAFKVHASHEHNHLAARAGADE
jgi:hypothetical protein